MGLRGVMVCIGRYPQRAVCSTAGMVGLCAYSPGPGTTGGGAMIVPPTHSQESGSPGAGVTGSRRMYEARLTILTGTFMALDSSEGGGTRVAVFGKPILGKRAAVHSSDSLPKRNYLIVLI